MTRAYVGLGSNVDAETNLRRAMRLLSARCAVVGISTVYRTEAIPTGGPPFLDAVVALETGLEARALKLGVLRDVEARLGRVRTADKDAPRTIDCDLLLFGDAVTRDRDLVLPAPDLLERAFLALPLLELAPDLVLPDTGEELAAAAARVPPHPMLPMKDLTRALRRELEETQP